MVGGVPYYYITREVMSIFKKRHKITFQALDEQMFYIKVDGVPIKSTTDIRLKQQLFSCLVTLDLSMFAFSDKEEYKNGTDYLLGLDLESFALSFPADGTLSASVSFLIAKENHLECLEFLKSVKWRKPVAPRTIAPPNIEWKCSESDVTTLVDKLGASISRSSL